MKFRGGGKYSATMKDTIPAYLLTVRAAIREKSCSQLLLPTVVFQRANDTRAIFLVILSHPDKLSVVDVSELSGSRSRIPNGPLRSMCACATMAV